MLRAEARQGIDAVVLTPHYYANENSPVRFLERRQRAWNHLRPYLYPGLPELYLGAEVQYFEGICAVEDIRHLRMEDTEYLLLEMPFTKWSDRMIEDVLELNDQQDIRVVLAHIERYMPMQSKEIWQFLREHGVLMQSNVSFFANWKTRHKALSMLKKGEIHFLGSDCHNKTNRPPNWDLLPEKAVQMAKDRDSHLSFERI